VKCIKNPQEFSSNCSVNASRLVDESTSILTRRVQQLQRHIPSADDGKLNRFGSPLHNSTKSEAMCASNEIVYTIGNLRNDERFSRSTSSCYDRGPTDEVGATNGQLSSLNLQTPPNVSYSDEKQQQETKQLANSSPTKQKLKFTKFKNFIRINRS